MSQLLWTFEKIRPLAGHPDAAVRHWAQERLTKLFPDQAAEVIATQLDDPDIYISGSAVDFLGQTGQSDRYGPLLLERLPRAEGWQFDRLALALARLNYRPTLPELLAVVEQRFQSPKAMGRLFSGVQTALHALGKFGGDAVRQGLWRLLDQTPPTDPRAGSLMEALLEAAQPEDIPRLIEHYRAWPRNDNQQEHIGAFAASVEARRLFEEILSDLTKDFDSLFDQVWWWLNEEVDLSQASLDEFEQTFNHRYDGVAEIAWREARRLVAGRGDAVDAWQAAWAAGEPLTGYPRRVVYTLAILEGFAAQPRTYLTRRQLEGGLVFCLAAQLSVERDDRAFLEAAADQTEALLSIAAQAREHVLPDLAERLVAQGPEVAPRLIDLFDARDSSWASIRIAKIIEQMARCYPGSCDAAVPKLIAALNEDQGDYLEEAVSDALEAIGPAAVPQINAHLRYTDDMSRQIYLTGSLGNIPVKEAGEVILEKLLSGQEIEEIDLITLVDLGDPAAIEPLYQLWTPGDHILAENLLVLCQIHGVEKPELEEWRRLVQAQDERTARFLEDDFEAVLDKPDDLPPQPVIRQWQLDAPASKGDSGSQKSHKKSGKSKRKKKKR